MTLQLRAILMVALAATGFVSGALVMHWKHGNDAYDQLQQQVAQEKLTREIVADITNKTLAAIGDIRVENRTIYQQARTEIVREPVYTECLVPVDGSVLLNQARGYADGAGGVAGRVPEAAQGADKQRRAYTDGRVGAE